MDFALAHGLPNVEAGAQGSHKLARGYLPRTTYSAHYIAEPHFRRAIENYLVQERRDVAQQNEMLAEHAPFRHGEPIGSGANCERRDEISGGHE